MLDDDSMGIDADARRSCCPICGGASLHALEAPRRWTGLAIFAPWRGLLGLSRCDACAFVFTNPRPPTWAVARYYSGVIYPRENAEVDGAPGAIRASALDKATALLARIERHVETGTLLDFGCTEGAVLHAANERGWRATGFDVGAAFERSKARGFAVTDRLEDLQDREFDAILLNQVFEHVEDGDGLLKRLGRLLSPAGKLFVQVPNLASLRAKLAHPLLSKHLPVEERYRAFPIHLSYFNPSTLAKALIKNGFEVRAVETSGLGLYDFWARDDGARELEKPRRGVVARRDVARGRRLVRDVAQWIMARLALGENVMVVATRTHG